MVFNCDGELCSTPDRIRSVAWLRIDYPSQSRRRFPFLRVYGTVGDIPDVDCIASRRCWLVDLCCLLAQETKITAFGIQRSIHFFRTALHGIT